MKITIGRDQTTNILLYTVAGQKPTVAKGAQVSNSVSRQHCELEISEDGNILIRNLKPQNTTWVEGMPVSSLHIKDNARIELSYERWPVDWGIIHSLMDKAMPKVYDISHLEQVWEEYSEELARLQRTQTMVSVYRGLIPVLTIGGSALIGVYAQKNPDSHISDLQPIVYSLAGILMVLFFVKSFIDAKRIPQKRKELQDGLIGKYSCPCCDYFFGYQAFNVLKVNNKGVCPSCKAKLKLQ